MAQRLMVDFAPAEGALLRIVGLVERRGYRVTGLDLAEEPCGRRARLGFDLVARDAGRRLDTLALQLRRLHGVTGVTGISDHEQEKAA